MTNEQLKQLEDKLWDSANALRAYGGLKASDYALPVLGLIFLRFADNKYSQYEAQIQQEYEQHKGTRRERKIEEVALATCGFYLPPIARYEYLLKLPGEAKMATALKDAMEAIEKTQDAQFKDVLPKDAYFDIEKKKASILPDLLRTFSDIPKDATGDVFGKIYEYFLGKFALSEGQKGGEFFTPTSVVRFIVEVIEPYKGKIFDPACGSGGMFVQSARFIQEASQPLSNIYVCGQEFMGETVRLAKMNLMVNSLRGEIAEVNSYETDYHNSYGKFDYVMANPPFNVKEVKESTVKADKRFTQFGVPKGKGKTDDRISDANYLWISLFATSLNPRGRAGFVMANSASDARNAEYDIRKRIVDSGIVDCMVSMPSNMFFTVTLPATLWFFDKEKAASSRKDKILFLDARNVYRQIDRAHREWTEEQVHNLSAIVRLYRGETNRYLELIANYVQQAQDAVNYLPGPFWRLREDPMRVLRNLKTYYEQTKGKYKAEQAKELQQSGLLEELEQLLGQETIRMPEILSHLLHFDVEKRNNEAQKQFTTDLAIGLEQLRLTTDAQLKAGKEAVAALWTRADKLLKLKTDKAWAALELIAVPKALDEAQELWIEATSKVQDCHENLTWLQSRFPDAEYTDITGLCKAATREEFVEEHEYSLNPGRYVGVDLEADNLTSKEFLKKLMSMHQELEGLNKKAYGLEEAINTNIFELSGVLEGK